MLRHGFTQTSNFRGVEGAALCTVYRKLRQSSWDCRKILHKNRFSL